MSKGVTLYQLVASPNNLRIRIALNYKKIPFKSVAIPDPRDRTEVVKASGQPLTPVITVGENTVFGSLGILRYLDANFRDTPPLYSEDMKIFREIENWERYASTQFDDSLTLVFRSVFTKSFTPEVGAQASRSLQEATKEIEEKLADSEWLVDNRLTAADIAIGSYVAYGMLPEEYIKLAPFFPQFQEHFTLGNDRPKTRGWVRRILAYDSI